MSQDAIITTAEELFGDVFNPVRLQNCREGFETHWQPPKEIGSGFISMIKLRPGLVLGMASYRLTRDIVCSFEQQWPFVTIGFNPSRGCYTVDAEQGREMISFRQGESGMFYYPEWQGMASIQPGIHTNVNVHIEPSLLDAYMAGQQDRFLNGMQDIFDGTADQCIYQVSIIPAVADMIIDQVMNCPYNGPLRRLYFEGKALELVTCSIASYAVPEAVPKKNVVVRQGNMERVRHAREMIGQNFQDPPKLLDLARAVGISHSRLNFYFQEMYGTTIFGYIRELRLRHARSLLDEGCMNITEVAYEAGYSSPSHFAKSFKDCYGVVPGKYLRTVSR